MAKGKFIKASLNATMEDAASDGYATKGCSDYVALFDEPIILHNYENTDSKITDISLSAEKELPFDIKKYIEDDSTKYAVYLPPGFWKRNGSKIYQNRIPPANTNMFAGSFWRKLTINNDSFISIPYPVPPTEGGETDFINKTIVSYCDIWAWVSEDTSGTGSGDKEWYLSFSDTEYDDTETGEETAYRAKLNLGTHASTSDAGFRQSMEYGLCIHVATIYKADDGEVFVRQLFHGIKEDYVDDDGKTYMPFDLKVYTAEGENAVLQTLIPPDAWMRDGIQVGGIDDAGLTKQGATDWYQLPNPVVGTIGVWAVLAEAGSDGGSSDWFEDISNAKLCVVFDGNSSITTAKSHNAAMKIATVVVSQEGEGEGNLSFTIEQHYHGFIKDGNEGGGVLVDTEDVYARIPADGNDPASKSIEKFTVTIPAEGEGSPTEKEYMRLVGMDETVAAGSNHNSTLPSPSDLESDPDTDKSFVIRQENEIKHVPVKTAQVIYYAPDKKKTLNVVYQSKEDDIAHTSKTVMAVGSGGNLVYMYPQFLNIGTVGSRNSVEGFEVLDGKLTVKYGQMEELDDDSPNDPPAPDDSITVDITQKNEDAHIGIISWKKEGNGDVTLVLGNIANDEEEFPDSPDNKSYQPYDIAKVGDELCIFKPVWKRYGANVPLKGLQEHKNGWYKLSIASGDVWAQLKKPSPSSMKRVSGTSRVAGSGYIAGTGVPFVQWYGSANEVLDRYLITYDGIDFQNDIDYSGGESRPEYQHIEYITALTLLRNLEYECGNTTIVADELLLNDAEEYGLETFPVIESLYEFLLGFQNGLNNIIYDLTEADQDDDYPIYRFIPLVSNPSINAYVYDHVLSKNDEVTVAGNTITAKDFIKLVIDKIHLCEEYFSVHADDAVVLARIKSEVTNVLGPIAVAFQNLIVDKIDLNMEDLKTEVYDQHLYLLTGDDGIYYGTATPDNLVILGGMAYTFNEIELLKTKVEEYCVSPDEGLEQEIISGMERLLQGDYAVDSLRDESTYALYHAPMLLPYYSCLYPQESLTGLFESRTVNPVSLGDGVAFTVSNETDYVKALLNKLAVCYNWEGHFFGKRQAILSVLTDMCESRDRVVAIMQDIRTERPDGTVVDYCGCGGGTKTTTTEGENGTWVKAQNSNNVFWVAYRGMYLDDTPPLVARATPSPRNVLSNNSLLVPMNDPILKGSVQENKKNNPNGRLSLKGTGDVTKMGGSNKTSSQGEQSAQQKKQIQDSILRSLWSADKGDSLDDIYDKIRDRNKDVSEEDLKALWDKAKSEENFPKQAMSELIDPNSRPDIENNFYLSYSSSGCASARWSQTPTNPVYHKTTVTTKVSWYNPSDETDKYKLTGIYCCGLNTGIVIGTPAGTGTQADPYVVNLTWALPGRDAVSAGQPTIYGSRKQLLLEARFTSGNSEYPIYIDTQPQHLMGQRFGVTNGVAYGIDYPGNEEDYKTWMRTPFVLRQFGGKVDFSYVDDSTKFPAYLFKEWRVNGVTTSFTIENPEEFIKTAKGVEVIAGATITAVYDLHRQTVILSEETANTCSFVENNIVIEKGQPFTIECVPNQHPDSYRKWKFVRWECLTSISPDPLTGKATQNPVTLSVPDYDGDEINIRAVLEEDNNYDKPPSGTFRVFVAVEGGGEDCLAWVDPVQDSYEIGEQQAVIHTACNYDEYYRFDGWICSDSSGNLLNHEAKVTNFWGDLNRAYTVKAMWTATTKRKIFIYNTGENARDAGCGVVIYGYDLLGDSSDITQKNGNADWAIYDPDTMRGIKIIKNVVTGYEGVDATKEWSYAKEFIPDAAILHEIAWEKQEKGRVGTELIHYFREGTTGDWTITAEAKIADIDKTVIFYSGSETAEINMISPASWTNPSPNGETGKYVKYTFVQYKAVVKNILGSDVAPGWFTEYSETSGTASSVATIDSTRFTKYMDAGATLKYAAYYDKEEVDEAPAPTGVSVNIQYDTTKLVVSDPVISSDDLITDWTGDAGDRTAWVKTGTTLLVKAEVSGSGHTWNAESKWTANGIVCSTVPQFSYSVKGNVVLACTVGVQEKALVYVKSGPEDANITLSLTGEDFVLDETDINSESIPTLPGYAVKSQIPVGKRFSIVPTIASSSYELDGIYNEPGMTRVSVPIRIINKDTRKFVVKAKMKTLSVPVTYVLKLIRDGGETETSAKRSDYGYVTGQDMIGGSAGETFDVQAFPFGSEAYPVEFTKFTLTFTKTDGSTVVTDNVTDNPHEITLPADVEGISVLSVFTTTNSEEPPATPPDSKSVNISVEPSGKGKVTIAVTESKIVGDVPANSGGDPFSVESGTSVNLTASETALGQWLFKKWIVTQGGSSTFPTAKQLPLVITGDVSVIAVFEELSSPPGSGGGGPSVPPSEEDDDTGGETDGEGTGEPPDSNSQYIRIYVASAPSEGGNVSPSDGRQRPTGSDLTLTAKPNPGWTFRGWTGGDTTGAGSTTSVSKTFNNLTTTRTITAYFQPESLIVPPADPSDTGDAGIYKSNLPWYAPIDGTSIEITSSPDSSAVMNCSAIHVGFITAMGNGVYQISQYYHGERVDYIDYGDADCNWGASEGFKSIVFNDGGSSGQESESNRKPARIYGFDNSEEEEFPERTSDVSRTDWQKYGILARKKYSETELSGGAELVYLKIPASIPEGSEDRDVLRWKPKAVPQGEGDGEKGAWEAVSPIGVDEAVSDSDKEIKEGGTYTLLSDVKKPEDTEKSYLLEKVEKKVTLKSVTAVTGVSVAGKTITATKTKFLAVALDDGSAENDTGDVDCDDDPGSGGGLPDGYTEVYGVVDMRWDPTYGGIQFKRGTLLVKNVTGWEDGIQFARFDA